MFGLLLDPCCSMEAAIILLVVLHFYFSMHGCLAARCYTLFTRPKAKGIFLVSEDKKSDDLWISSESPV